MTSLPFPTWLVVIDRIEFTAATCLMDKVVSIKRSIIWPEIIFPFKA